MANHYTTNKDAWRALADIDYYSMFVKAYIPFNAWMSVEYNSDSKKSDREIINIIKRDRNPFKDKICSLLESDDQDGQNFRNLIIILWKTTIYTTKIIELHSLTLKLVVIQKM